MIDHTGIAPARIAPPGPRPQVHSDDDGASVPDLDSNTIQSVCHNPA
ncbi:MAG: hypothetical protein ACT4N9_02205 [Paracoccaceae bacterium]